MEIRRFFADLNALNGNEITLLGDEFLHITKVLRMKVGFKAYVCLNDGFERLCEIKKINGDCVILEQESVNKVDEKGIELTLFCGLLKNNKLDFTIQKCVELGVDKVQPFLSQNCAENKFNDERANKIAREAAKQCGSVYLTEVLPLVNYEQVLSSFENFDTVILAYEFEKIIRIKDIKFLGKKIALIVGAEGGFKESEILSAKDKGAKIVTLGKRILRAETAGIVASCLTLDTLGELDYES